MWDELLIIAHFFKFRWRCDPARSSMAFPKMNVRPTKCEVEIQEMPRENQAGCCIDGHFCIGYFWAGRVWSVRIRVSHKKADGQLIADSRREVPRDVDALDGHRRCSSSRRAGDGTPKAEEGRSYLTGGRRPGVAA